MNTRRILAAGVAAGVLACAGPAWAAARPGGANPVSPDSTPRPPAGCSAAPRPTPAGPMYRCSFPAHAGVPARAYWLYVPPAVGPRPALVVYLHGCEQNGVDAAYGTHWNRQASTVGFLVAYPEQTVPSESSSPVTDGNGAACWNWYLPQDQQRGGGEPAAIAGITQAVASSEQVDRRRIYVDGASAGADMSVILAATYPDLYAAYGAVAGCPYRACADGTGQLAYAAMGSRHRVVPALVEQGTADTLNAFPLGQGLVSSWLLVDDRAERAAGRPGVSPIPTGVDQHGFDQTPAPGTGDTCVHNLNFPCPGGVVGFRATYPYTVEHFDDGSGCEVLAFWIVHGLEHAYPDGSYDPSSGDGTFTDPLGPDLTAGTWRFFAAHPYAGTGCVSRYPSGR